MHAGNGEFHYELQVHRPTSADDVEQGSRAGRSLPVPLHTGNGKFLMDLSIGMSALSYA